MGKIKELTKECAEKNLIVEEVMPYGSVANYESAMIYKKDQIFKHASRIVDTIKNGIPGTKLADVNMETDVFHRDYGEPQNGQQLLLRYISELLTVNEL